MNNLTGHENSEKTMLEAFASGKLPNAWLISGPKGIGKATLAHKFAKFLLTNKLPSSQEDGLFGDSLAAESPETLEVDENHPALARIEAGSHGDFMVISAEDIDDDKVKQEISIDEIRKVNEFLSLTPSEADMRVVIVDSADEMNRNAANAILKILEEPPLNSIILMISHNPGKLLPTIRSRCRFLKLHTLSGDEVKEVVKNQILDISEENLNFTSALAEGSPGRALELYNGGGVNIYSRLIGIFQKLPEQDIENIDKLGSELEGKKNRKNWLIASYLLQYFLAEIVRVSANDNISGTEIIPGENDLKTGLAKQCSAAKWAEIWEKIGKMSAEADYANLDKKHALINMLYTIQKEVA